MSPKDWRIANSLTLDALARQLGVGGVNPAGTYRRWEAGIAACPIEIVVAVERMSGGDVTAADWLAAKRREPAQPCPPEPLP